MSAIEKIQADQVVMSVASALALANEAAVAAGTDPQAALITIAQEQTPSGRNWRIRYGPRDYINRRGGGVTVVVDEAGGAIRKVLRGQ
jgi:hypothetical protein